jgi:hypothetical protein
VGSHRLKGHAWIETHAGRARFPTLESWVTTDVRAWTLVELISGDQLAELLAEAPRALAQFRTRDGAVDFRWSQLAGGDATASVGE